MRQIETILVVSDREDSPDGSPEALAKAGDLARLLGARVEPVLCDGASARKDPCLAVRGIGASRRGLAARDWELVRTCPVPLLLTRGKPWKPRPVIAAAVDLSAKEPPALTRRILRTAQRLAEAAQGSLEVLHAGRFCHAPHALGARREKLEQEIRLAEAAPAALHLIDGDPVVALSEFAAACRYDLIVLGSPRRLAPAVALEATLAGRLLAAIDCDLLLVGPATTGSPMRAGAPRAAA